MALKLVSVVCRSVQRTNQGPFQWGNACLSTSTACQPNGRFNEMPKRGPVPKKYGAPYYSDYLMKHHGLVSPASVFMQFLSSKIPDPKPPKRPLNSYMLFSVEKRPSITQNNAGLSAKEISKILGELWRNLPDGDKKVYSLQADENLKQYELSLSDDDREQIEKYRQEKRKKLLAFRKKRMLKSLEKPRNPPNAYIVFLLQKYKSGGKGAISFREFGKKLGTQWMEMSSEEKLPYQEEAERQAQKYEENLGMWEKEMLKGGHPEFVRGYEKPRPAKKRPKKVVKKKTAAKKKSTKTAKKTSTKTPKKKSGGKKQAKSTSAAEETTANPANKSRGSSGKSKGSNKEKVDPDPSWMREE